MVSNAISRVKQFTALVTGATGFVGGHLAAQLVKQGWQVHILCRVGSCLPDTPEFSQMNYHIHDGTTEGIVSLLAQIKPDVVFHLASLFLAQHESKDVEFLIQSNVLFGNQLLEGMRANGVCHLINTGSSWQHFNNEDYNPVCLYAATKQAFEVILEFYIQAFGFKAITLKLFDTYGPGDLRPKLFNLLKNAAMNGEPLNMSAGNQLIDLVFIDDVIEAYLIAAERLLAGKVSGHECYVTSSGQPLSLRKLVELYLTVTQQTVQINWGARPYRFREVIFPYNRGVQLDGWKPKISLEDGLKSFCV